MPLKKEESYLEGKLQMADGETNHSFPDHSDIIEKKNFKNQNSCCTKTGSVNSCYIVTEWPSNGMETVGLSHQYMSGWSVKNQWKDLWWKIEY